MCRQRVKSAGKSSPSSSSGKSSGKGGTSGGNTDKCYCCGQVGHRRPDCLRRNESCSPLWQTGTHRAECVDLLVGTQVLGLSRARNSTRVGTVEFATFLESRLTLCLFATTLISRLANLETLLNMIMDSGAEEHVVSLADWRSLGEPLLKPAQVRLRSATGDDMGVLGSFMVRGWCDNQNGGVDSFGSDSSYQVSVFSNETGECWLQHLR